MGRWGRGVGRARRRRHMAPVLLRRCASAVQQRDTAPASSPRSEKVGAGERPGPVLEGGVLELRLTSRTPVSPSRRCSRWCSPWLLGHPGDSLLVWLGLEGCDSPGAVRAATCVSRGARRRGTQRLLVFSPCLRACSSGFCRAGRVHGAAPSGTPRVLTPSGASRGARSRGRRALDWDRRLGAEWQQPATTLICSIRRPWFRKMRRGGPGGGVDGLGRLGLAAGPGGGGRSSRSSGCWE